MYAELAMIKIGPGMRPMAEKVADELAPIYKAMKVFRGVISLGEVEAGEYGSLSQRPEVFRIKKTLTSQRRGL